MVRCLRPQSHTSLFSGKWPARFHLIWRLAVELAMVFPLDLVNNLAAWRYTTNSDVVLSNRFLLDFTTCSCWASTAVTLNIFALPYALNAQSKRDLKIFPPHQHSFHLNNLHCIQFLSIISRPSSCLDLESVCHPPYRSYPLSSANFEPRKLTLHQAPVPFRTAEKPPCLMNVLQCYTRSQVRRLPLHP